MQIARQYRFRGSGLYQISAASHEVTEMKPHCKSVSRKRIIKADETVFNNRIACTWSALEQHDLKLAISYKSDTWNGDVIG